MYSARCACSDPSSWLEGPLVEVLILISISEMALHFLNKYNLLTIKIGSKWELRRLCRAVNATALVRMGPPMADEMGLCDAVYVKEIGDKHVTVFEQGPEK